MYDRFTDRARKVLQLANQEAKRFNHRYLDTEHILLGLIIEGAGVAAHVLKNLDVDLAKVRRETEKILQSELEKIVQSGREVATWARLPLTSRAEKVMEYSIEEARNLGHNYVGTEHLLLGLLREKEGVAARVLTNLRLNLEDLRRLVLDLLHPGQHCPPAISAAVEVEDLSWLPTDIEARVREFNDQIRFLEQNKKEAIAEQNFERAADLRDQADQLRRRRNEVVGASLHLVKDQDLAKRIEEFHERIEALRRQEQEAISKGYFSKASQLRDEINRLHNQ